jgi:hypothetical protein
VAAALALAGRAVGLTEISGSRITPHDWRVREKRKGPLEECHRVCLRTPWRRHLT